jgi:alpha,alpha-trehalose phosphorylase
MCAEVGHLELAHDYAGEAALVDLRDLHNNTRDGLHMASLAGSWIAAVAGFGGMRCFGGELSFRPRLPAALSRVCFRVMYRHECLTVTITPGQASYELNSDGDPLTIRHEESVVTVRFGEPVSLEWSVPDPGPEPRQPPGREPARRRPR